MLCARKKETEEKLQIAPSKVCVVCETSFTKTLNLSQTQWKEQTLCSRACGYKSDTRNEAIAQSLIGNSYRLGSTPYNKGKVGLYTVTEATRKKLREVQMVLVRAGKHHLWKGGITPLVRQIRTSKMMKDWKKAVFQRDDYTCQSCNIRGYKINADHIKEFSVIIKDNGIVKSTQAWSCKELWNTDNGQTLCEECHSVKTAHFLKSNWSNQYSSANLI